MKRTIVLSLAALSFCVATPARSGSGTASIEGLLSREELSSEKIEKAGIRSGAKSSDLFRVLTGLWAIRAPSQSDWDDVVGPALEDAMGSERPIEELRATALSFEENLLAGPRDGAVRVTFELPGERGEGFVAFVAPALIGPDPSATMHIEGNKFHVVTGAYAEEVGRNEDPVVLGLGLQSTPTTWTSGDVKLPKLNPFPESGEGNWAKYKGKSAESGDDLAGAIESIQKLASRDTLAADRMLIWPGASGDKEGVNDTLSSARYRTRAPDIDSAAGQLALLKSTPVDEWDWTERSVKHPIRYGIATVALTGELEKDRGTEEAADIFAFLYFYTPLFIGFEEAHLYVGASPEFFAKAVQQGELPFFEREGEVLFYTGDLDRWVAGEALEPKEKTVSRRLVEGLAERWVREMDSKDARTIQGLAKDGLNWPLRLVEDDDSDSDNPWKALVAKDDLVSWWRRFESAFRPDDVEWSEPRWVLKWSGEAATVDVGTLFQGKPVKIDRDAVADGDDRDAMAKREESSLSAKDRARLDEQRAREDAERKKADDDRKAEDARRAEEKKREDQRKASDEAARQAQADAAAKAKAAPIEVLMLEAIFGTPAAGSPYLATKAGSSIPIKVKYEVGGDVTGHLVQMVAQGYDREGREIPDLTIRSTKKTPVAGANETTAFLKVPSSWTVAEKLGSYKVVAKLELDAVPVRGEREEMLHVGSPLLLKRAELDPSVVVPGEKASLLLDLDVGGWPMADDVAMTVTVAYTLGSYTHSDTLPLTRGVGTHALEMDVDVPKDIPAGDGSYAVTVAAGSAKAGGKGTLKVFSRDAVADSGGSRADRSERRRVDDEDDELSKMVEEGGGTRSEREVVRQGGGGDDVDFDSYGDDEEPKQSSSGKSSSEKSTSSKESASSRDSASRSSSSSKSRPPDDEDDEDRDSARRESSSRSSSSKSRPPDDEDTEDDDEDDEDARRAEEARRREADARRAEDARKKDEEAKRAEDARKKDEDARRAEEARRKEEDARRAEDARKKEEASKKEEDDMDLDDLGDGEASEGAPKAEAEEAPPPFDFDNLPETVFFEEDEEEVGMWAEADGVGIVRVYGDYAVDRMAKWYGAFEKAFGNGAPAWLWILYEGKAEPKVSLSRFSVKASEWMPMVDLPGKFGSKEQEQAALQQMQQIFEGFVPDKKKVMPYGKY